jgi:hypothetical protein
MSSISADTISSALGLNSQWDIFLALLFDVVIAGAIWLMVGYAFGQVEDTESSPVFARIWLWPSAKWSNALCVLGVIAAILWPVARWQEQLYATSRAENIASLLSSGNYSVRLNEALLGDFIELSSGPKEISVLGRKVLQSQKSIRLTLEDAQAIDKVMTVANSGEGVYFRQAFVAAFVRAPSQQLLPAVNANRP